MASGTSLAEQRRRRAKGFFVANWPSANLPPGCNCGPVSCLLMIQCHPLASPTMAGHQGYCSLPECAPGSLGPLSKYCFLVRSQAWHRGATRSMSQLAGTLPGLYLQHNRSVTSHSSRQGTGSCFQEGATSAMGMRSFSRSHKSRLDHATGATQLSVGSSCHRLQTLEPLIARHRYSGAQAVTVGESRDLLVEGRDSLLAASRQYRALTRSLRLRDPPHHRRRLFHRC